MTSTKTLLLAIALSLPLATGSALAAQTSAHDHGQASPVTLELNAGQKWTTDAPLRQAMSGLHEAVARALPAVHEGTYADSQYDALSEYANKQVAYMVENCKLEPQADAQLHIIVAEIVNGADIASGKQPAHARTDGVVKLAQALNHYGQYFDHSNWQGITLSH